MRRSNRKVVYLTDEEYEKLKFVADSYDISEGDVIRMLINEAYETMQRYRIKEDLYGDR